MIQCLHNANFSEKLLTKAFTKTHFQTTNETVDETINSHVPVFQHSTIRIK